MITRIVDGASIALIHAALAAISAAERLHAWARERRTGVPPWVADMAADLDAEQPRPGPPVPTATKIHREAMARADAADVATRAGRYTEAASLYALAADLETRAALAATDPRSRDVCVQSAAELLRQADAAASSPAEWTEMTVTGDPCGGPEYKRTVRGLDVYVAPRDSRWRWSVWDGVAPCEGDYAPTLVEAQRAGEAAAQRIAGASQ